MNRPYSFNNPNICRRTASDSHSQEAGPSKLTLDSTSDVRAGALQSKTRDEMIEDIKTYLITAMSLYIPLWLPLLHNTYTT